MKDIRLSLCNLPRQTKTQRLTEDRYTEILNPDDLGLDLAIKRENTFTTDFRLFAYDHTLQHSRVLEADCAGNPANIIR
jgi:hypothetical protein